MHPSLQHAAQTVLEAFLASSDNAATRPHPSSAQLAALLQLLQEQHTSRNPTDIKHRTGPTVSAQLTYKIAQCYLEQAVGFSNLAEVHLWLDCLPKASAEDGHSRYVTRSSILSCRTSPEAKSTCTPRLGHLGCGIHWCAC